MITTVDNKKAKKGDVVWEIGTTGKEYKPTRSVVGSSKYRLVNEERCWSSYDLCFGECSKLNLESNLE